MRLLNVDDESLDLLEVSAAMMMSALNVRAARVDPDQLISKSVKMSEFKLGECFRQLRAGPPSEWDELTNAQREVVISLAHVLINAASMKERGLAFRKLRAAVFHRNPRFEQTGEAPVEKSGGLQRLAMGEAPTAEPQKPTSV